MFRGSRKVIAAVSGGPDSVALLLTLIRLREQFGFEVIAGHFDHQLRPDSAQDLKWVRETCLDLGVPCFTGEGDVARAAAEQGAGIEDAARRMRYGFLGFVAGKEAADTIATGHTRDDQVETVLMRIVRGTGIRGLRGIVPVGEVPGGGGAQRLVRPLLELRRQDTERICAEGGITPLYDPSNTDRRYTRNRVRHEILPALRAINPEVAEALLGLAASAREAFEGIEKQSYTVQPTARLPIGAIFDMSRLAALPEEAIVLVVEREAAFFKREPEVNRTRIENLRSVLTSGAGEVAFGEVVVEASCAQVRIGPALLDAEHFAERVLSVPGVTIAGSWRVTVATDPLPISDDAGYARVGGSELRGALRVRPLAPGDRIRYQGMERKVSDLLVNEKVPAWERLGLVAIADGSVVHAIIGASKEFCAPDSEDALHVRFERA